MREIIISVKYSDEELEQIDFNAERTGRKRSTYIRETSLGVVPKEMPSNRFYEDMKCIRSISNNLNQLTKRAHAYGYVNDEKLEEEIKKLNKFMLKIKSKYLES